jgi:uncharacterized protein (TIGR02996 family)
MTEEAFLRAIEENPDDDTTRLVFADWLEERGDWRAEFVRLDVRLRGLTDADDDYRDVEERWRLLRYGLNPLWQVLFDRSPVERCGDPLFKFRCPKRWGTLRRTPLLTVRFCESCRRNVHYCRTIDEAREHAACGHCVAVNTRVERRPGDLEDEDDLVLGEFV